MVENGKWELTGGNNRSDTRLFFGIMVKMQGFIEEMDQVRVSDAPG